MSYFIVIIWKYRVYALIDMINTHFVVLYLDNFLEPLTLAGNEYFWRKKDSFVVIDM
jgi:hypothetical protein